MKKRKMYLIIIVAILSAILIPLLINRIFASILNGSYADPGSFSKGVGYTLTKLPIQGDLEFDTNDSSADYVSSIYMDTLNLNFKVIAKVYAGSHDNFETIYITFDQYGKILEKDRYIPLQTDTRYQLNREKSDGDGNVALRASDVKKDAVNHILNCRLLDGVLPPWPKWKQRTSPVYISHFAMEDFHPSDLNPFEIGGINGNGRTSIWYGTAYCDIRFMDKLVKLKIPFGYDNLLWFTNDYHAKLQYYKLPKEFEHKIPVRFLQLEHDIYILRAEK